MPGVVDEYVHTTKSRSGLSESPGDSRRVGDVRNDVIKLASDSHGRIGIRGRPTSAHRGDARSVGQEQVCYRSADSTRAAGDKRVPFGEITPDMRLRGLCHACTNS